MIGLAGGSGTGKGTVCAAFKKYNITSIDTDDVYHKLTSTVNSPCLNALISEFGERVINSDGILDRAELAKIVFAEDGFAKRERLNKIAHYFVLDEVRNIIKSLSDSGYDAVLVDAPLLFESGFDKECDIILCVISEKNARIKRIMERDNITRDAAVKRIDAQLSDEFLIQRSDYVIYNNGTEEELEHDVADIANKIKNNKKEI